MDQTQSAKESITVELDLAVETIQGNAVSNAKSSIGTRRNDAIEGIDITAKSCTDAFTRVAAQSTTSLRQSKDQFER